MVVCDGKWLLRLMLEAFPTPSNEHKQYGRHRSQQERSTIATGFEARPSRSDGTITHGSGYRQPAPTRFSRRGGTLSAPRISQYKRTVDRTRRGIDALIWKTVDYRRPSLSVPCTLCDGPTGSRISPGCSSVAVPRLTAPTRPNSATKMPSSQPSEISHALCSGTSISVTSHRSYY